MFERSHALDDRRKVMVKITKKGSGLVAEIRQDVVQNYEAFTGTSDRREGRAWRQLYRKIADCSDKLPRK